MNKMKSKAIEKKDTPKLDKRKALSPLSLSYKIIHTVMIIVLFPIIVFVPMFRFVMTVSTSNSLGMIGSLLTSKLDINQMIKSATGIDFDSLPELWSIKKLYTFFFADGSKIDASALKLSDLPQKLVRPMETSLVLFAAAIVLAVAALVLGIVLKKKWITGIFTGVGTVFCLLSSYFFNSAAKLLISGVISPISLVKNLPALESVKSYLSFVNVDIRILSLNSAFSLVTVILAVLTVFSLVTYLVEKTYNAK